MESSSTNWSKVTRFLHLGLAIAVTLQLFLSLVMEVPKPGKTADKVAYDFFEAHEIVGLTALAFVLLHWVWLFFAKDTRFSTLFPWGGSGIRQILQDLKTVSQKRLLHGGPGAGGLVGLVHGFGLLAVTGMVITGGAIFYLLSTQQVISPLAHRFMDVHSFIAGFVWVYWVGHGAMALVHMAAGEDTVGKMFSFGK